MCTLCTHSSRYKEDHIQANDNLRFHQDREDTERKTELSNFVEPPSVGNHVQMSLLLKYTRQVTLSTPSRSTHSSMNRAIVPLLDHYCLISLVFKVNRNPTNSCHVVDNLLEIPDNKDEIPTPEVADKYSLLQDIADYLVPLDSEIDILPLIGRDLCDARRILGQRIGPSNDSFAHNFNLVIEDVCL